MRTLMTVVGIGSRKAGIGKKSGKSYDMTEISFVYNDSAFKGQKAETIAVSADLLNDRTIAVGDVLDVVCHQYNFKTQIDAIL